jgi:dolichyl-phosphate beta-glucosyltransferase
MAYAAAVADLAGAQVHCRRLELAHGGKGSAVRAGVAAASGDPIAFLDADLTIPVETIDAFLEALQDGADVVVASRYVPGSVVDRPWWRIVMGWVYRTAVHAIVPIDVNDTQCGGKMYTAEAAKALFARSTLDGFAFDAEVLFIARQRGYRVVETPVQIHQRAHTSVSFLRDTPVMLRDLVIIRWNGLRGRYA